MPITSENKVEKRRGHKPPFWFTALILAGLPFALNACTDVDNGDAIALSAPVPVSVDTIMTPTPDVSENDGVRTPEPEQTLEAYAAPYYDADGRND